MPRFFPFAGVRYRVDDGRLDALVSPPYDVVSPSERERLAALSELNSVRLELPVDEDGADRYQIASRLWREWREAGRLSTDPDPAFYVYRMGHHDDEGRPRQTTGVIGALELAPPGEGIVPHEHTTPKDKADRLSLLRACRANLSPIWVLTPASGLTELCEPAGPPDARATDEGVHHRLWRVTRPATLEAISELVGAESVIVADGHHRYETGLAYQAERRDANQGAPGAYDAIMACVVELSDEQLTVKAVHRLLSGLAPGTDVPGALSEHFDLVEAGALEPGALPARMAEAASLALVTREGTWLLRPRAGSPAADEDVDSRRLDVALKSLPEHQVAFQHGADQAVAAVESGQAQAAVLLRPATVAQIAAAGEGGRLLPPKTTFFEPKLRTGMVFREVPG